MRPRLTVARTVAEAEAAAAVATEFDRAQAPTAPGFHGEIDLRYIDGRYWKVLADLIYCSPLLQTCLLIPAGTISNLGSVPKALWWYMAPTDPRIAAPALVHDDLYHLVKYRVTREEADQVLREAMGFVGASKMDRFFVYRFLRLRGSNYSERGLGT